MAARQGEGQDQDQGPVPLTGSEDEHLSMETEIMSLARTDDPVLAYLMEQDGLEVAKEAIKMEREAIDKSLSQLREEGAAQEVALREASDKRLSQLREEAAAQEVAVKEANAKRLSKLREEGAAQTFAVGKASANCLSLLRAQGAAQEIAVREAIVKRLSYLREEGAAQEIAVREVNAKRLSLLKEDDDEEMKKERRALDNRLSIFRAKLKEKEDNEIRKDEEAMHYRLSNHRAKIEEEKEKIRQENDHFRHKRKQEEDRIRLERKILDRRLSDHRAKLKGEEEKMRQEKKALDNRLSNYRLQLEEEEAAAKEEICKRHKAEMDSYSKDMRKIHEDFQKSFVDNLRHLAERIKDVQRKYPGPANLPNDPISTTPADEASSGGNFPESSPFNSSDSTEERETTLKPMSVKRKFADDPETFWKRTKKEVSLDPSEDQVQAVSTSPATEVLESAEADTGEKLQDNGQNSAPNLPNTLEVELETLLISEYSEMSKDLVEATLENSAGSPSPSPSPSKNGLKEKPNPGGAVNVPEKTLTKEEVLQSERYSLIETQDVWAQCSSCEEWLPSLDQQNHSSCLGTRYQRLMEEKKTLPKDLAEILRPKKRKASTTVTVTTHPPKTTTEIISGPSSAESSAYSGQLKVVPEDAEKERKKMRASSQMSNLQVSTSPGRKSLANNNSSNHIHPTGQRCGGPSNPDDMSIGDPATTIEVIDLVEDEAIEPLDENKDGTGLRSLATNVNNPEMQTITITPTSGIRRSCRIASKGKGKAATPNALLPPLDCAESDSESSEEGETLEVPRECGGMDRHCAFCLVLIKWRKVKVVLCGGCMRRAYCSIRCQKADWKTSSQEPVSTGNDYVYPQGHENWCGLEYGEEDLDWKIVRKSGVKDLNGDLGMIAVRDIPPLYKIFVGGIHRKFAGLVSTNDARIRNWEDIVRSLPTPTPTNGRPNAAFFDIEPFVNQYKYYRGYSVKILFSERAIKKGEEIIRYADPSQEYNSWRAKARLIHLSREGIIPSRPMEHGNVLQILSEEFGAPPSFMEKAYDEALTAARTVLWRNVSHNCRKQVLEEAKTYLEKRIEILAQIVHPEDQTLKGLRNDLAKY